jgi:hypothetical protein
MMIIKCVMRDADGLCSLGTLCVNQVTDGQIDLANVPCRLARIGVSKLAGWGTCDDDEAVVYKDPECAWSAIVPRSELARLGL